MRIPLRRIPYFIAAAIALHFIVMVIMRWIMNSSFVEGNPRVENMMATIFSIAFLWPQLLLCKPWYPVLERMGLISGEWWRMPTGGGLLLVNFVYVVCLVIIGLLLGRMKNEE